MKHFIGDIGLLDLLPQCALLMVCMMKSMDQFRSLNSLLPWVGEQVDLPFLPLCVAFIKWVEFIWVMCWNLTIAWMHRGRVDRLNAVSCTNFTKFKNFAQPNSWWAAFTVADIFGCVWFNEMFSNYHRVQNLKVYTFSEKQPLLAAPFPLPKHITRVLLCQSIDSWAGAWGPNIQKKITTPSWAEDVNFFILFVQQATN